jgi:fructose/tagatose bisphosphate aldolase
VKAKNIDLEAEGKNARIYLNADHTYSFEKVAEAVDAGFDMVIYDDAGGDIEKNIEVAKKCRKYIDEFNKKNGSQVLFEAELGYIGKGSEVRTDLPDGIQKTKPEDALKFVKAVKPDLLAPAIGKLFMEC